MMQAVDASAGGTFLATRANGVLGGARLAAGAAADATAVLRETDGAGKILAVLAAPQKSADESTIPVQYRQAVHVTVTGADAVVILYQE